VLACRPPNHYGTWAGDIEAWIVNAVVHAPERVGEVLCFFGVGDHGGGPTRENLASIDRVAARADLPEIGYGSLAEFFANAAKARQDYPVRRNDLQHHAPGCYSVHSGIKRWNRQAEQLLVAVEKASVALALIGGAPLAGPMAFEEVWRPVLFSQFHDILAGTSIVAAYDDAAEDFAEVRRMGRGMAQVLLERLAEHSDCGGDGRALFVFNPGSRQRLSAFEVESDATLALHEGRRLPSQRTHDGKLLVKATLPALGGHCLHLDRGDEAPAQPTSLAITETSIENEFWSLRLDRETGEWLSLYDKEADVEVLARPGNALVVLDDPSDTWSHGVSGYHVEVGRFSRAQVTVLEQGPLRASLLVKRRQGRSLAEERISLYASERAIEVRTRLDWHDTRKALKVSFPIAVGYPVCSYEAPYGVTVRVANGEEEPGQTWVDASGVARTGAGLPLPYGVSLINESKYGFDMKGHGGYADPKAWTEVRMTILRSPAYAFHDPRRFDPAESYAFIDQGEQDFAYWLLPHRGSWREAGTVALAREKNAPLLMLETGAHQGGLPAAWSLIECRDANVEVGAAKAAEDGDGTIIRLHETAGMDCQARLALPLWGLECTVPLRHHEVKTLRLRRMAQGLRLTEVDLLERSVPGGLDIECAAEWRQ
jgi:alpha-mannosidase